MLNVAQVAAACLLLVAAAGPVAAQAVNDFQSHRLIFAPSTEAIKTGRICVETIPRVGDVDPHDAGAKDWDAIANAIPGLEARFRETAFYGLSQDQLQRIAEVLISQDTKNTKIGKTVSIAREGKTGSLTDSELQKYLWVIDTAEAAPKDAEEAFSYMAAFAHKDLETVRYFKDRIGGVESDHFVRFARVFQLKKLVEEGEYSAAIELADSLIAEGGYTARFKEIDKAEEVTWLTPQTIENATIMFRHIARLSTASEGGGKAETLGAFLDYLDDRPNLEPVLSLFNRGTWDETVLLDGVALGAERYELQNDNHVVPAAWTLGDHAYLVFQGKTRHTVELDVGGVQPPRPPGSDLATASGDGGGSGPGGSGGVKATKDVILLGVASVISGEKAMDAYHQFVQKQLDSYSTDNMMLYDVRLYGDEVDIVFPEKQMPAGAAAPGGSNIIRLSKGDLSLLNAGGSLPVTHPYRMLVSSLGDRAAVQYTSPFAFPAGTVKDAAAKITFAMQRAAPESRIYRDPLSDKTDGLVASLNDRQLGVPQDYAAVVDDGSFKLSDRDIIKNIRADLTANGIDVISAQDASALAQLRGSGRNIIVITAHSSEELAAFTDYLGEKGVFEKNFVIFNSCGTALTRLQAEKMLQKYSAAAVFQFEDRINPGPVEDLLVELTEQIKKSASGSLVDQLRAISKQVNLDGIWTISHLSMPKAVKYG